MSKRKKKQKKGSNEPRLERLALPGVSLDDALRAAVSVPPPPKGARQGR